jgi:transcriptional regulator with XRE-family HTH domain
MPFWYYISIIRYFQAFKDIIMVFFRNMTDFSKRLRSEIEYIGLKQKEFAAKAGIKKRALDAYLRTQQSMPPADTAVKIAAALGLSVEYLVTGKEYKQTVDISRYLQFRDILDDLAILPDEILDPIKAMIKTAANNERKKSQA